MSDVDDFLAHYGVPGMKWGRRNARKDDSSGSSRPTKAPKTPMSREKKIAIAVGIGAIAAIGAGVAMKSLNKNMDLPVASLASSALAARGKVAAEKITVPRPPTIGVKPSSSPRPGGTSLNLGRPAAAQRPSSNSGLNLGAPSRNTSPSYNGATSPSLGDLNNLINGGPKIVYDPKTGQYTTR